MADPRKTDAPPAAPVLIEDLPVAPVVVAPKREPKRGDETVKCMVRHGELITGDGRFPVGSVATMKPAEAVQLQAAGIVEIQ